MGNLILTSEYQWGKKQEAEKQVKKLLEYIIKDELGRWLMDEKEEIHIITLIVDLANWWGNLLDTGVVRDNLEVLTIVTGRISVLLELRNRLFI